MDQKLDEFNESNAKKLKIYDSEDIENAKNDIEDPSLFQKGSHFGIKERVNKQNELFNAILKQSYCDFIVNEVDIEGNVVRLTNFDIPTLEEIPKKKDYEIETINDEVKKILGEDLFEKLKNFLASDSKAESMTLDAPKKKFERKLIHDFVKQINDQYATNTFKKDEVNQVIEIVHFKNKNRSARDTFKINQGDKYLVDKNFTICVMYKENIDTIQAVNLICKHLRLNVKRVGYSGTKDKKAKTTQLISFFKISPKEIDQLNKNFHNIKLGNFRTANEGLKLGDLSGNTFKIVLREVSEKNDSNIIKNLESLKNNGFLNYFGLQRFGNSFEVPTHLIGKFLLLNKIKEAIHLILRPRADNYEKEEIKKAREIWSTTNNPNRALFHIQNINCIEKFLLKGLSKCSKNDYLGAFQHIPRNMRSMYLHAYQSFIWNEITSKRVQLFGLKPVIGDLIRSNSNEVLYLTKENIELYTIENVVLPLPGNSIIYPENQTKNYYNEILKNDGLSIQSFKNKIKDLSLTGDYRNILVKPKNFKYEIINCFENSHNLIKSDWDLINSEKQEKESTLDFKSNEMKAVCLEYTLPTSSYATMALREILND